jgi:phosphate/sulfate permease
MITQWVIGLILALVIAVVLYAIIRGHTLEKKSRPTTRAMPVSAI